MICFRSPEPIPGSGNIAEQGSTGLSWIMEDERSEMSENLRCGFSGSTHKRFGSGGIMFD